MKNLIVFLSFAFALFGVWAFVQTPDFVHASAMFAGGMVYTYVASKAYKTINRGALFCGSITAFLHDNCKANPGGLSKIYAISEDDLSTMPDGTAGTASTGLTVKATKGFAEIGFKKEKGGHKFKLLENMAVEHTLEITHSGFNAAKNVWNGNVKGSRLVFAVEDRMNNGYLLIGGLKCGLNVAYEHDGGDASASEAATKYTFTGVTTSDPIVYTGTLPLIA
jgi:hypothetical protein